MRIKLKRIKGARFELSFISITKSFTWGGMYDEESVVASLPINLKEETDLSGEFDQKMMMEAGRMARVSKERDQYKVELLEQEKVTDALRTIGLVPGEKR